MLDCRKMGHDLLMLYPIPASSRYCAYFPDLSPSVQMLRPNGDALMGAAVLSALQQTSEHVDLL
jgi:hypothetical protein